MALVPYLMGSRQRTKVILSPHVQTADSMDADYHPTIIGFEIQPMP